MSKHRILALVHAGLVVIAGALILGALFRLSIGLFAVGALVWAIGWVVYRRMVDGRWPLPSASFRPLEAWAAAVDWFKRLRADWIARRDQAPDYWETPPLDEDHARYRSEYVRLATSPNRTRADLALLAEMLAGLQAYGDDPLAKPPTLQARAFAELSAAGTALNAGLTRWTWVAGALMLAALVALYGWVRIEQSNARASCSALELEGRTDRQPCLDLASAQRSVAHLRASLDAFQRARPADVGSAVNEGRETVALNQRRAEREQASEARRRRAQNDDLESVRESRAPDWNSRLRDLAQPAGSVGDPDAGAASGDDPPGGVPGGSPGASGVPDSDAGAEPLATN